MQRWRGSNRMQILIRHQAFNDRHFHQIRMRASMEPRLPFKVSLASFCVDDTIGQEAKWPHLGPQPTPLEPGHGWCQLHRKSHLEFQNYLQARRGSHTNVCDVVAHQAWPCGRMTPIDAPSDKLPPPERENITANRSRRTSENVIPGRSGIGLSVDQPSVLHIASCLAGRQGRQVRMF